MFLLSKAGWFLGAPSTFLVLLAALALIPRRPFRRVGLACLGLVLLLGLGPASGWMLLPLENRFPQPEPGPVDGVIVLGGSVLPDITADRRQLNVGESGDRVIALADLARRYPQARLVFSGGSGNLVYDEPAEADALKADARTLGLDPARIIVENRSRTTFENAVDTRALVRPQPGERWLLVTSAWHMPRAVGCFRQAGFAVVPYPVDYLTAGPRDLWRVWSSVSAGLGRVDLATKEWVGLAAYRLTGRTDALFPGPQDG